MNGSGNSGNISNRAATASVSCRDSLISVTRKKPTSSSGRRLGSQSREGFYGSTSNGSSGSSISSTTTADSYSPQDLESTVTRTLSSTRSKASIDYDAHASTNHVSLPDIGMSRSKFEKDKKQQLLLKDDQEFIEKLKLKVEEQQLEIEKSNGSLEQIQRNFEQLSAMYKNEKSKSEILRLENERLKEESASLRVNINSTVSKVAYQEVEQKLNQLFTELKEKEETKSELEKENTTLKANLFDLNVKIKNMIQELDSSRREIDHQGVEFKKQSEILKQEAKTLNDQLSSQKIELEDKKTEIVRLEARLKDKERNISALQQTLSKKDAEAQEYREKLHALEKNQEATNSRLKEKLIQNEDYETNVRQLDAKNKENIRYINDLKNQISEMKTQLRDKDYSEKESQQQVRNLLDEIENYVSLVKKLEEEVSILRNDRKELVLEKQIKDLTMQNSDLLKQIEIISSHKKKLEGVSNEKEKLVQLVTTLQHENAELTLQVETLSRKDQDEAHIYSELMKVREDNEELSQKLEEATQKLSQVESAMNLSEIQVRDLESLLKFKDESIEILNTKINQKEKELREKDQTYKKDVEKERAIWKELTLTNTQLESTISNLHSDIQKIQKEMNDNKEHYEKQIKKEQLMMDHVHKNQKYLQATIEKLIKAEETTVSSLTCTHCFQLFEDPCLLVPCSHTYCSHCWNALQEENESCVPYCPECNESVNASVRVGVLDGLAKKSAYRKEQLQSVYESVKKFFSIQ
ncbi:hypothetical protein C9374_011608 [Naegleria lovaniensis]|uniref:RING-type domain-containing protein n=1 Tax=Naegleria lovaniensis TaxID=51637 RepID=A0AA88GEY2_NAELO|nr:uncharacterized protein C9374_011608 [Naegleria lovaniensis]KAG2373943.1 hypothetical protein C9374_011608 [Naegleria lovaniensis]